MGIKFANNAYGVITQDFINNSDSIYLSTEHILKFPVLGANDDYFLVTLFDAYGNIEIVKCDFIFPTYLSVVERGSEGTTLKDWFIGTHVELRVTAGGFTAVYNEVVEAVQASADSADDSATRAIAAAGTSEGLGRLTFYQYITQDTAGYDIPAAAAGANNAFISLSGGGGGGGGGFNSGESFGTPGNDSRVVLSGGTVITATGGIGGQTSFESGSFRGGNAVTKGIGAPGGGGGTNTFGSSTIGHAGFHGEVTDYYIVGIDMFPINIVIGAGGAGAVDNLNAAGGGDGASGYCKVWFYT